MFWRNNHPFSEYEGGGTLDNLGFPKGSDALDAHDKLRLQSLTGQETNPKSSLDSYHWYGNVAPSELNSPIQEPLFNPYEN